MLSLIPGIGIIEDNQEILYQLKEQVSSENDKGILKLQSVVATENMMTVNFEFTRKNYTEEQMLADKNAEWDNTISGNKLPKKEIHLKVDDQQFEMASGSSAGGGVTESYSYNFDMGKEFINPSKNYILLFNELDISVQFQIITIEQYNSLDKIGSTDIHNNISLTATAIRKDNELKVNVYPINHTDYNLISFNQEYDLNYFNKKLTLKTDKGDKTYTLPSSYGSGMNAAYTFDVSDGATDYTLSVPFIVVESKEESKITLPIPKVGEVIELNKQVDFDNGSVIIKSVEKIRNEGGNQYGDLKINLEYISNDENWQLVQTKLTNKGSEGWAEEYDEQNRLSTIYYMLNESDKSKLKLYVTKPRYSIMDEYQLKLDVTDVEE